MNCNKYFLLSLIFISCVSAQESNLKKIDISLLGGLSSVLEAKTRLTHTERDDLYEGQRRSDINSWRL